jgi:hypothetical protein
MNIMFEDNAIWLNECVFFHARIDEHKLVKCCITREVLDDHFDGDGVNNYLSLFHVHKAKIFEVAKEILQTGQVVDTDSLLLIDKYF